MATLESISGRAGQYGYANGAPILNASVAQSLLGDEFYKPIDLDENQLGWGTNSKYQGAITTGAGLYGVKGTQKEIRELLATGDRYTSKISESGTVRTVDPETGQVTFSESVQGEDGVYYRPIGSQMFNTATGDDNNAEENFNKWKNITSRLQTAASDLKIDYRNLTGGQLLDAINSADKRVAVTGRTQFWDPTQTGIGGQEGTQHATVVYTQQNGKLVPVAPPQTFEFQDYKTSGVFRRPFEGIIDLLENPAIRAAVGAMLFTPGGILNSGTTVPGPSNVFEFGYPSTVPTTDYSLLGGTTNIPRLDGISVTTTPLPPAESIGITPVDYSLGTATSGFGLTTPTTPGITSMGGMQGLTVPVEGGTVSQGGLTPTGATPVIGAPGSFINNPAVLGQPVITTSPAGPSATDVLRLANAATQLTAGPQQPQDVGTPQQGGPTGIDYSGLLSLLASQARATGLLGTRYQPQPINLASLLG